MLSGMNFNSSSIMTRPEKPSPFYNNSIHYEENPFRQTNNQFRATNRGFSANRPKPNSQAGQSYKKPFKDPDVWDSPPPLEKRQSVQKVNKVNTTNKNHQIRNIPQKKKN